MKIAKPMLLVSTPIGLVLGIYEGFHYAGGLVFVMIALIGVIGAAMGTVVATVRRERREEEAAAREAALRNGAQSAAANRDQTIVPDIVESGGKLK